MLKQQKRINNAYWGIIKIMKNIGKIDLLKFKGIVPVLTDEVVITEQQIEHIRKRHPHDYENFGWRLPEIIADPDYILLDNLPNTALIIKSFAPNEHFQIVLRLKSKDDPDEYKNSIITFLKTGARRIEQYIRNKKVVYKKG
jgi:hypothetical protein